MISLDKKILDSASAVAKRMIEYGKTDELFILVPSFEKKEIQLSNTVQAFSTGGNKLQQLFRLKKMGLELIKKYEIKFVTVQDPSFIGNIGRWLKKKIGVTLEVQLHGDFYSSDYYKKSIKNRIGYFLFGKKNILAADRVRVVSERVRKSLGDLGIDARKIYMKPVPTFDLGHLVTRQVRDLKNEYTTFVKRFLYVGRLEEVKNVEWLIDVFGEIVTQRGLNYGLLILGEGSQLTKIREIIEKKNLSRNIICKGWADELQGYYSTADCLLIPSLSESYSRVAMEAYAAGTPIIMNDVGVANHELKPSDKVKILPINDREKWIQAIISI